MEEDALLHQRFSEGEITWKTVCRVPSRRYSNTFIILA